MELPEGFKRFALATDKDSDECYEQYDCEMACELMKEMSEALEVLCEGAPRRIDYELANQVLKKFKEWK